jgi:hypothetical protein
VLQEFRIAIHEVLSEEGNLLGALAQSGHGDLDHVQPVVEVVAEAASRDRLLEVLIGSGEDPNLDLDGGQSADPAELHALDPCEAYPGGRMQISISSRKMVP